MKSSPERKKREYIYIRIESFIFYRAVYSVRAVERERDKHRSEQIAARYGQKVATTLENAITKSLAESIEEIIHILKAQTSGDILQHREE